MEEGPAAEKKLVPLRAVRKSITSHRGIYYVSLTAAGPLLLHPEGKLSPAWDSLYWTHSGMPSRLFPIWLLMNILYAWFDDCVSYIPVSVLKHHDLQNNYLGLKFHRIRVMMVEERQQVAVMATEAESDGSHLESQARD